VPTIIRYFVSWTKRCPRDGVTITFPDGFNFPPHYRFALEIPYTLGIVLPPYTVPANNRNITFATDALSGPVPARMALSAGSPGVVSLGFSSRVAFLPPSPATTAAVFFEFTPDSDLRPGDEIYLKLHGITGPDLDCFQTEWSIPKDSITSAGFNASAGVLSLRISNFLAAKKIIQVQVPKSFGIVIPDEGVSTNEPRMLMQARTSQGDLSWTPIPIVNPVGYFALNSSLSFNPPVVNVSTEIVVNIIPRMNIAVNESISIFFPNLQALDLPFAGDAKMRCIALGGAARDATFNASSSTLTMTVSRNMPKGILFTLIIPPTSGIRIHS
jgi:hypothetical protein